MEVLPQSLFLSFFFLLKCVVLLSAFILTQQYLFVSKFEQASGDSEGQGNLAWCSPWGCKESDMTNDQTATTTKGHQSYWIGGPLFSNLSLP